VLLFQNEYVNKNKIKLSTKPSPGLNAACTKTESLEKNKAAREGKLGTPLRK
jgi:hypothetical protein